VTLIHSFDAALKEYIVPEHKKPLWKNYHFWAIVFIFAFLIFIYLRWPWREWDLAAGLWGWMEWLSPLYHLAVFEVQYHIVGSLLLIPVIYASIVFKWQGSLAGLILLLIGISPVLTRIWNNFDSRMINITLLISPIAIMMLIRIELEFRRKEKNTYIEREREYRTYLTKILETQEKERRKLAEELHDESVQTLLAVASYAESVELTDENMSEIKSKAAWIKEKTRSTVEDLRRMSIDLRPGILDDMGLVSALKWLTNRTNMAKWTRVHLTIENLKQELSPELEVNIFRIVQEALHNVEKHAKAKDAFINIETSSESLILSIQDNGEGFILPENFGSLVTGGKLGLIGMQERVRSLGGTFKICSKPGEGTAIAINIPFRGNPD
jgi:signal transduction histidine kinase